MQSFLKRKGAIVSLAAFLIFLVSPFLSGLLTNLTGFWTLPFVVVTFWVLTPAQLLGGFTCEVNYDLIKCNNFVIALLYVFFSLLYSLILLPITSKHKSEEEVQKNKNHKEFVESKTWYRRYKTFGVIVIIASLFTPLLFYTNITASRIILGSLQNLIYSTIAFFVLRAILIHIIYGNRIDSLMKKQ